MLSNINFEAHEWLYVCVVSEKERKREKKRKREKEKKREKYNSANLLL